MEFTKSCFRSIENNVRLLLLIIIKIDSNSLDAVIVNHYGILKCI